MYSCFLWQRIAQVETQYTKIGFGNTSARCTQLRDLLTLIFQNYEYRPLFGFSPKPLSDGVGVMSEDLRWISYGDVHRGACAVVRWLRKAELAPGSFVAAGGHNTAELLTVMLGCWLGGFVFAAIAPSFDDECTVHILRETGAQVVFTNPTRVSR